MSSDCPRSARITPSGGRLPLGTSLKCEADAVPPANYQWLLDSSPVDGATSSEYTLTSSGNYTIECIVTNFLTGTGDPCSVTIGVNVEVGEGKYLFTMNTYEILRMSCTIV